MRLYKVQHSVFILRSPRFVILTLDVPRFRQKCTSLYKTVFWSGHQHALTFSLWANYFLAVFSKVHEFVKNIVLSPQWARFVIFALGVPLFSEFQQSARVCTKQRFRRDVSTFCHFRTGHNTSYLFWAKCASFYKTAFSDRDQNLLSFSHWAQQFLAVFSKVLKFVQNSIFSPRSARFVTSALSAPILASFSKLNEFVKNSVSSTRSARFVNSALGTTLLSGFLAKYTSLYKTGSPAQDQHVSSFLHWVHQFLAILSQSTRACTKQRIQREISTFCHFRTGHNTF